MKNKCEDIVISLFPEDNDKVNYKKSLYWKTLTPLEKRISEDQLDYKVLKIIKNRDVFKITLLQYKKEITYNSEFIRSVRPAGFYYDYKTKKSTKIGSLAYLIKMILKDTNLSRKMSLDWLLNTQLVSIDTLHKFTDSITKDLLLGKITNEKELLKRYLKLTLGTKKNIPIELFIKEFKSDFKSSDIEQNRYYKKEMLFAVNYENFILNYKTFKEKIDFQLYDDLIHDAFLLKKKIDFTWSVRKVHEVHSRWSKEITAIKVSSLQKNNVLIKYKNTLEFPKGIKILDSKKSFYEEGEEMKHCIFSNDYFDKAKKKQSILLSYRRLEKGTAEIKLNEESEPKIVQFNGTRNKTLNDKSFLDLYYIIENKEVKEFLINNLKPQKLKSENYTDRIKKVISQKNNYLNLVTRSYFVEDNKNLVIEYELKSNTTIVEYNNIDLDFKLYNRKQLVLEKKINIKEKIKNGNLYKDSICYNAQEIKRLGNLKYSLNVINSNAELAL